MPRSVVSNAALSAFTADQEFCKTSSEGLRAAYGVWLLESREIWAPRAGSSECGGLALPPADGDEFDAFADAVVRSARIEALLTT